jgi:hypothetical protein
VEDEAIAALRGIENPLERARRAQDVYDMAMDVRDEAIIEAAGEGRGATEIARTIEGISPQRVSQILRKAPPAARGWWGEAKCITVAVGLKTEAGKPDGQPGPVIAVEDAAAREALRDYLATIRIDTLNEEIAPPGFVDLNRDGLVVICGPRLSPLVAQVLASDRFLRFGHDDQGWMIEDQETAAVWHSPLDEGQPADIGYLGRLPRPDRQGTFVYMAGIHAAGAAGCVHWLTEAGGLGEVWHEARDHRFSTLIRCTLDPATHQVISSERITPLYRQEP